MAVETNELGPRLFHGLQELRGRVFQFQDEKCRPRMDLYYCQLLWVAIKRQNFGT